MTSTAGLTLCKKCGAEFVKTKRKYPTCNACQAVYLAEYRARRKAEGNPVVTGKVSRERRRETDRIRREKTDVKAKLREAARLRYADPVEREKALCRRKTRHAIKTGILQRRPCRDCGAPNVQAHPTDYSQHLLVEWLCPICHYAEHHAAKTGSA